MNSKAPLVDEFQTDAGCPRCGKKLTDPTGLGWCPGCGYCRSLEEGKDKVLPKITPAQQAASMREPPAPPKTNTAASLIWTLPLLGGIIGIAALSIFKGDNLPLDSFPRALWMSCQLGLGIVCIFVGQFIALVCVAGEDEKISIKDMFIPGRIWGHVFRRLPSLAVCVWLAGWGLAMIVAAFVFIGGLSHWLTYLPGQKNHPDHPSQKIKQMIRQY